jgi:NADPH2:quinone reductase
MRAARYHEYGDPEVIQIDELPKPTPGPDELLIEVHAASINPVDTMFRRGIIEAETRPTVVGVDLAGMVTEVGAKVDDFDIGDRVFGTGLGDNPQSTFAEYAISPAENVAHLPESVPFETGAGAAHAGGTAWRSLVEKGRLQAGDTCLIHGASGGVGHLGVQIAAASGAKVIGTAGSAEGRDVVNQLGADVTFDYGREDLQAAIADESPHGVDVVLDYHLDEYLDLDIEVAAHAARIVHIAGDITSVSNNSATRHKELTLQGVAMHSTPDIGEIMQKLSKLLEQDKLTVHIHNTYSLAETKRAHHDIVEESVIGKLIMLPRK